MSGWASNIPAAANERMPARPPHRGGAGTHTACAWNEQAPDSASERSSDQGQRDRA